MTEIDRSCTLSREAGRDTKAGLEVEGRLLAEGVRGGEEVVGWGGSRRRGGCWVRGVEVERRSLCGGVEVERTLLGVRGEKQQI